MDKRFAPTTGTVLPRFAGIATFMRLPWLQEGDALLDEVD
ncbi:MAG: hypothetical protein RLZZ276_3468, partial [Pseudomonadota bacterium]